MSSDRRNKLSDTTSRPDNKCQTLLKRCYKEVSLIYIELRAEFLCAKAHRERADAGHSRIRSSPLAFDLAFELTVIIILFQLTFHFCYFYFFNILSGLNLKDFRVREA